MKNILRKILKDVQQNPDTWQDTTDENYWAGLNNNLELTKNFKKKEVKIFSWIHGGGGSVIWIGSRCFNFNNSFDFLLPKKRKINNEIKRVLKKWEEHYFSLK